MPPSKKPSSREPPIVALACKCGWEYPRDLFLARSRTLKTEGERLAQEDLQAMLRREPLCVYFVCPRCSVEVFADIAPLAPRIIPAAG
jgi:hypothetical protein